MLELQNTLKYYMSFLFIHHTYKFQTDAYENNLKVTVFW